MENDLISRKSVMDKLYAKANEWRGSYSGDAYATAARMVKKEQAVDAVEVCRCKDCKHSKWRKSPFGVQTFTCELLCADIKPDDFCSYGERRTDDGT